MNTSVFRLPFALGLLALLTAVPSCSSNSSPQQTAVIKLSPDEVATLLGISSTDDLKIGAIESGREGVLVASLSFKNKNGKEVEIEDIELVIGSPEDLVYEVTSLRISEIDFHDWETTQRTTAKTLHVSKPGTGFIPALEEAIANGNKGSNLSTGTIPFEKMSIENIDYLLRKEDASLVRVGVVGFQIADATADMVGEISVEEIRVGNEVSIEKLRVTNIDRQWADFLLSLASQINLDDGEDTASVEFDAGRRVVPFDHFSVGAISFRNRPGHSASGMLWLTIEDLKLEIERTTSEALAGLNAEVHVRIPMDAFPKELGEQIRAIDSRRFTQSVTGVVNLAMTVDPSNKLERFNHMSVDVPSLFHVSGSMVTQDLAHTLAKLLVKRVVPEDFEMIRMLSLDIEYRDEGMLRYMVSNRNLGQKATHENLRDWRRELADGTNSSYHNAEITRFISSPRTIHLEVTADTLTDPEPFFRTVFEPDHDENPRTVKAKLSFQPR